MSEIYLILHFNHIQSSRILLFFFRFSFFESYAFLLFVTSPHHVVCVCVPGTYIYTSLLLILCFNLFEFFILLIFLSL